MGIQRRTVKEYRDEKSDYLIDKALQMWPSDIGICDHPSYIGTLYITDHLRRLVDLPQTSRTKRCL